MTIPEKITLITLLGIVSCSAFASDGWSVGKQSTSNLASDPNSGYLLRSPIAFQDDITPDQDSSKIKLTDEQKHEAKVWQLAEVDEKRYVMLMKNRAGTYYKDKNMTPVEVLGMNARDNKERQFYAQLQTQQMIERSAKEKAFGADVQQTMDALHKASGYPTVRKYDVRKYSPHSKHALQLLPGDKLVFFTKTSDQVKPITSQLIKSVSKTKNTQLDVFLVDKSIDAKKANKWARSQSIPVELVSSKKITINLGKGQLNKINKNNKTPLLILIRNGESESVDVGKF